LKYRGRWSLETSAVVGCATADIPSSLDICERFIIHDLEAPYPGAEAVIIPSPLGSRKPTLVEITVEWGPANEPDDRLFAFGEGVYEILRRRWCDDAWVQPYRAPDRSNHVPNFQKNEESSILDLAWNEGILSDGRPYRVELSRQGQITKWTFFFSTEHLERFQVRDFNSLLADEGLVTFTSATRIVEASPMFDATGEEMWAVAVVVRNAGEVFVKQTKMSWRTYLPPLERRALTKPEIASDGSIVSYPTPDRSDQTPNFTKTEENDALDLAWNIGHLSDGRPYRVECWCQDQVTMWTFFFSTWGLELGKREAAELLEGEGLVSFLSEKRYVEPAKWVDCAGNELWSVNVVIGDDEATFVGESLPLIPYRKALPTKPEKPVPSVWQQLGTWIRGQTER
jgi:hypothetical protein